MEYTVTFYQETGLQPGNVLSTPALLQSFNSITSTAMILKQDRQLTQIKVPTTYDIMNTVDYCQIGQTCYYVINYTMVNDNLMLVDLAPDYFTTVGIDGFSIISGWATQAHSVKDDFFDNIVPENFIPLDEMTIEFGGGIGPRSGGLQNTVNLACSNVDITDMNYYAKSFIDPVTEIPCTMPCLFGGTVWVEDPNNVRNMPTTTIGMTVPFSRELTGVMSFELPMSAIFEITPAVKMALNMARSYGIENAVTSAYSVPYAYLDSYTKTDPVVKGSELKDAGGYIAALNSSFQNKQKSTTPLPIGFEVQGHAIQNNKCYSGQFQFYRLYSILSGAMGEYRPEEIVDPEVQVINSTEPEFIIFADVQPNGRPYCRPRFYKGNYTDVFMECVEGAEWQNYQIVYQEPSGQVFAAQRQNRSRIKTLAGAIKGIGDMGFNLESAMVKAKTLKLGESLDTLQSLFDTAMNGVGSAVDVVGSEQEYFNNKTYNVPDVYFPLASSLQNYFGNGFILIRYRLSDRDMIRLDTYFTRFGYATWEPLTKDMLLSRTCHNYIKAIDVNIYADVPLFMRQAIINQIQNGVRIWHVVPSAENLDNNPIRSA